MLLGVAACHNSTLEALSGSLLFSSPDQPEAVTQPDAGLVRIDFGEVVVTATRLLTLDAVSLASTVTLTAVTAVQPDPEFAFPLAPGTIDGSQSATPLAFSPDSAGPKSAVYELTEVAPASGVITVVLTGTGVLDGLLVAPNPVDFGSIQINQVQSAPVTITNSGKTVLTLAVSGVEGPDAPAFAVKPPSATILAPGDVATVGVSFAPLTVGATSASFEIGDSSGARAIRVGLIGTGIDSWLQATSPLDFGFVPLGKALSKSAQLTNQSAYTTFHVIGAGPSITQAAGSTAFTLGKFDLPPVAIGPGQTIGIPVWFAPASSAAFSGTLSVQTDAPKSKLLNIELKGYGGGPKLTCLPTLDFGPTPLGFSVTEPTLCTNTGSDIPGHPEIALAISQSALTCDDAAFTAQLSLPDGGLAGPSDSVSLTSGQTAPIEVTFRPTDAGVALGRLTVAGADPSAPDAGVLLAGEGLVPGSCSLQASPLQLTFGEVPPGNSQRLQFELSNTGQDFCVVTSAAIDPASDPAFSLPSGPLDYALLSFAGNPNNPAGRPTSLDVSVQFAPSGPDQGVTGTVDVTALHATAIAVALGGVSQPACLDIAPPSHDFGLVGLDPANALCLPNGVAFTASNACSQAVTITSIGIDSGRSATPQFALDGGLTLPLTLAPGAQASFEASFVPTGTGPKLGSITVASSEFPGTPFLLTLQGDGEKSGQRTDTFTAPAPVQEIDFLWVVDNDDDLAQIGNITRILPKLVQSLNADKIDYRMALTSTDTCDLPASDQGAFEPCDHCLSTAATSATIASTQSAGSTVALAGLFDSFDIPPQVRACAPLNGDEHFFDAIAEAFAPSLLSGHNAGLLRPEAFLAVLVVNGDAEDDAADRGLSPQAIYVTSRTQVTNLLQGLKASAGQVSVSYINSGAGTSNSGLEISQLVQDTGGLQIDTNLPDWEAALLDLVPYATGEGAFRLSAQPASVSDIQVLVDGVATTAWSYLAVGNEIIFDPGHVPPAGAIVTVTYSVGCS